MVAAERVGVTNHEWPKHQSTSMALNWDYVIKFVIIGDSGVGKSSLLVRLTDQRFLNHPDPTLGVEFGSKLIRLEDEGKTVKLQCWDTAGTESFRSITRSYYRGAAGALVVYDVSNRNSFNSARTWLADVRQHADPNLSCMLVANKTDLCTNEDVRQVTKEEAQTWADEEGLQFLEASAKSGENVDAAFELICRDILKKIKAGVFEGGKSTGVKQSRTLDPRTSLELERDKLGGSCCG